MKTYVIGIAGGSGSGKTTITQYLEETFQPYISVINHDNYYKSQDGLTMAQRALTNYDHPDAFETDLMIQHIIDLKNGKTIECPVYDFTVHNRSNKVVTIASKPIILVEGILIFENPALCDLMDLKVYVDTDADVRILRRLVRDVKERERSVESVVDQYLTTVKPMHEAYVEPSKKNADIIIPEGGHNTTAIGLLVNHLISHLRGQDIDFTI